MGGRVGEMVCDAVVMHRWVNEVRGAQYVRTWYMGVSGSTRIGVGV